MANSYFQFKQFIIHQDKCAMKVTTDSCLFGAWVAEKVGSRESGVGSQKPNADYILDIGTGTGLLSLMLAQKNPGTSIDSMEIDKEAVEQARENVEASQWCDRIKIFHSDAREFDFQKKYDVIISNPPFYENEMKSDNSKKNLAHHNEGLLLPELLTIIKKILKPDGKFFLLLPYKRNDEIRKIFNDFKLSIPEIVLVRQSTLHNYFRLMVSGKIQQDGANETRLSEISIRDESQKYTSEFITLLRGFYLDF